MSNHKIYKINKITKFVSGLVVVLTVFLFSNIVQPLTTFATINKQINYQGKLTTLANVAVTDAGYNMTFGLYAASSGGSPVWTETFCYSPDNGVTCNGTGSDQRVAVTNGLFSTMLGSVHSLVGIDFNQTLYLGVTVSGTSTTPTGEAEMTPRKIIGSVPSAFVADTLQGLTPSSFFRTDVANSTSSATTSLSIQQLGAGKIAEFFGLSSNSVLSILSSGNINATGTLSVAGLGSFTYITTSSTTATSTFAGKLVASNLSGTNTGDITLGTANGLSLAGQILSLTFGYNIPLTASTTVWQNLITSIPATYVPYTGATGGVNLNNQSLVNLSTLSVGSTTAPTGGVAWFNGNVGIGKAVPSTALDVVGTASSTGLQVNGNGTITGNLNVGALVQSSTAQNQGTLLQTSDIFGDYVKGLTSVTGSLGGFSSTITWAANAAVVVAGKRVIPTTTAAPTLVWDGSHNGAILLMDSTGAYSWNYQTNWYDHTGGFTGYVVLAHAEIGSGGLTGTGLDNYWNTQPPLSITATSIGNPLLAAQVGGAIDFSGGLGIGVTSIPQAVVRGAFGIGFAVTSAAGTTQNAMWQGGLEINTNLNSWTYPNAGGAPAALIIRNVTSQTDNWQSFSAAGTEIANLTKTGTLYANAFYATSTASSSVFMGNVGIGTTTPSEKLSVIGNILASGTILGSNFTGTSTGSNSGDLTLGTGNGLSLVGQALSLALSSTTGTGALSSTDWNIFNGKLSTTTVSSTYVSYTGANANVNLGSQTFTTTGVGSFGNINSSGVLTFSSTGYIQTPVGVNGSNSLSLLTGDLTGGGGSGSISLTTGEVSAGGGSGGINLTTGDANGGVSDIRLTGGNNSGGVGGSITLAAGTGSGGSGAINITGSIIPTASTYDLGSASYGWANAYTANIYGVSTINGGAIDVHNTLDMGGNTIYNSGMIIPSSSGVTDLGGASNYWNGVYATNVYATSFIKPGGSSSQFLKADGSVDNSTYLTTVGWSDIGGSPMNYSGSSWQMNGNLSMNSHTLNFGGASTQFVKADGSVDSTIYLASTTAASTYVPYSGAAVGVNLNNKALSNLSTLSVGSATAPTGGVAYFNGNVGIGTTAPGAKLSVEVGAIASATIVPGLRLSGSYGAAVTSVNSIDFGYTDQTASPVRIGSMFNANGAGMELGFYTSTSYTSNGTEHMRIDMSGNVGIGSTTPISTLAVKGTAGTNPFTISSSTDAVLLTLLSSGNLGVGTSTPQSVLTVAGTGYFTGLLTAPYINTTSSTATSTFAGPVSIAYCVTGDTKIRRRKRKTATAGGNDDEAEEGNEYDYEDVPIKEIGEGDEVESYNEDTQSLVFQKVRSLYDMGIQEIWQIETAHGFSIRTTSEHPYYVRLPKPVKAKKGSKVHVGKWTKVKRLAVNDTIAVIEGPYRTVAWDTIVKISILPVEQVYDLEISDTHNFVGNCILAHNTFLANTASIGTAWNANAGTLAVQQSGTCAVIIGDTSGNARGACALDVQSYRSGVGQVASGIFSSAFGNSNTAAGSYSSASGFGNYAGNCSTAVGYCNTACDCAVAVGAGLVAYNGGSVFGSSNSGCICLTGNCLFVPGGPYFDGNSYGCFNGCVNCASNANGANCAFGLYDLGNGSCQCLYYGCMNINVSCANCANIACNIIDSGICTFMVGCNNSNYSSGCGSAFGTNNMVCYSGSSAFGNSNIAGAGYSSAFGNCNYACGWYSSTLGYCNCACGGGGLASGYCNFAGGYESTALGTNNWTNGNDSTVVGACNCACGLGYGSAFGYGNLSCNYYSSAFGYGNCAMSDCSVAVGYSVCALNNGEAVFGSGLVNSIDLVNGCMLLPGCSRTILTGNDGTNGYALRIAAGGGAPSTPGNGAALTLSGGAGNASAGNSGSGGALNLYGGAPGFMGGAPNGGAINIVSGNGQAAGSAGNISIFTGTGGAGVSAQMSLATQSSGNINLTSGTCGNILLNSVSTSTGKVGVGTSSPSAKLDVWGNFNVATGTVAALSVNTATGNTTFGSAVRIQSNTVQTGGTGFYAYGDTTYSGNTTYMTNGALHVQAQNGGYYTQLSESSLGSGGPLSLIAGSGNTLTLQSTAAPIYMNPGTGVGIGSSTPISTLSIKGTAGRNLFTVSSSTDAQLFTILQNGNVGIGSTTPSSRLSVTGTTTITNGALSLSQTNGSVNIGDITGDIRGACALDVQSYRSGVGQVASGIFSSAFGNQNTACGYGASAFGYNNCAYGCNSVAFGYANQANYDCSVAVGIGVTTPSNASSVFGSNYSGCISLNNSCLITPSGCYFDTFGFYSGCACCAYCACCACNVCGGYACSMTVWNSFLLNTVSCNSCLGNDFWNCGYNTRGIGGLYPNSDGFNDIGCSGCSFNNVYACYYYGDGSNLNMSSGKNIKTNFVDLSKADILAKIDALDLRQWSYQSNPTVNHIGPFAQDFATQFGLGNSTTSISIIDPAGVALVGVQGLSEKFNALASTTASTTVAITNLQLALADIQSVIGLASTSTSTANLFGGSQINNFVSYLQSFGAQVVNGVIHFAEVAINKVTVNTLVIKNEANVFKSGYTIYDRATGQPICVFFENGVQKTTPGDCDTPDSPSTTLASGAVVSPTIISINSTSTGTTDTATSIATGTSTAPASTDTFTMTTPPAPAITSTDDKALTSTQIEPTKDPSPFVVAPSDASTTTN